MTRSAPPDAERPAAKTDQALVDAFLDASRALVAVAARSLADAGENVTLAQYRALVVLSTRGPHRPGDLAERLGVTASTASRMVERLVRKGLVRRTRSSHDRRTVRVHLTEPGQCLVDEVIVRRREEIERILAQMPERGRSTVASALRAFAAAAGEAPEPDWALGWDQ